MSEYGKIVQSVIESLSVRFENAVISDYVIMPNHIHMIIILDSDERAIRESPLRAVQRSEISKIIGYFKMNVSKQIHLLYPEAHIWQRGYYDHVIRDEDDYFVRAKYIFDNPAKWLEDKYYSSDQTL